MEGEITCQAGEIYKVHEKKKEKGIVKKAISRVITCTGVGIILLLAVPIVVCAMMIAAVWWTTDKIVSAINSGDDF
ncbi:MAG TPA: hypothetical protein IAD22_00555 [Candidatus Limousia pullorum]|uniref:Uncharacterized protein n=1 Tax=Candidatus Limousia pullorum TaxID=2840860 RepID=A0A9D1LWV1_9FIRM|nr:hypothetical protein [Candidatus Limousia pullorum]